MSDKSKIEWTDATWNPVTGCTKVSSGCENCYMFRDWPRLAGNPKTKYYKRSPTDVMCHPSELEKPLRWKKPRKIFVNSMSDLFHEKVPFKFIDKVLAVAALCPQHTFTVLTKRPERMAEYINRLAKSIKPLETYARDIGHTFNFNGISLLPWPLPNLWLGVSVEDQKTTDQRIPKFLDVPAAVRFISYEPALGAVDLENIVYPKFKPTHPSDPIIAYDVLRGHMKGPDDVGLTKLDWVIAGGESGPGARPSHPDWFRKVRDDCQAAGVPFFMKQMAKKGPIPDDLLIREFPNGM